ncbi:uncharacterized protein LOC135805361 [Sycon ciliatum]|uniref:uncharacterized protein LOC135805361 n=1 Tax=Sycon ciliatum TaxID=27933 RepID=UPI0020AD2135|eukprot:scpid85679/ scgid25659/ 
MYGSNEQSALVSSSEVEKQPLYYDATDTPTVRKLTVLLAVFVGLMSVVAFGLSVVQTITKHNPFFVLPGVGLLAFAQLHYFVLYWLRKNIISKESQWYLYATGASVIVEAVITIVLVFVVEH